MGVDLSLRAVLPLDTVLFCELLLEGLLVTLFCSWLDEGSLDVCEDFLLALEEEDGFEVGLEWSLDDLTDSVIGTALWGDLQLAKRRGGLSNCKRRQL